MQTQTVTYRGEQLWGGDGRAVAVQLDAAPQVEIADLHRRDLHGGQRQGTT